MCRCMFFPWGERVSGPFFVLLGCFVRLFRVVLGKFVWLWLIVFRGGWLIQVVECTWVLRGFSLRAVRKGFKMTPIGNVHLAGSHVLRFGSLFFPCCFMSQLLVL